LLAQPTTLTTTMRQRDVDENAEGIILYYAKALSMQGYGRCSLGCGLQSHGLELERSSWCRCASRETGMVGTIPSGAKRRCFFARLRPNDNAVTCRSEELCHVAASSAY
jgi:hypothetical protein